MSEKNGKKIVEIKENPANKTPENPETNEQTPAEDEVKYTVGYCLRHPVKAIKHAFEEHPVATGVIGTGTAVALGFGVKALCDVLGGGESNEEDDDLEDLDDLEDEDDEEDEI